MIKANNFWILFLITILFFSCKEDSKEESIKEVITNNHVNVDNTSTNINLNVSFLLDLSDRISPVKYPNESMEFYLRDVAYIKSVSEAFDTHLRGKKVRQMNDKIQLYFDPEPKNQNINNISSQLKYSIERKTVSLELLDELKNVYATKPIEIYDSAINDDEYIGSDTWRFFKNKIKDYCIEDEFRNILVILTDGYIYHKNTIIKEENRTSYLTPQDIRRFKLNKNNWKEKMEEEGFGFISTRDDLENIEILVLGINPDKKNPYEEDVIMKYWKDWFYKMNVGRFEIKTAVLPADMDNIIKDFILNN
jgi:hypothetical protein